MESCIFGQLSSFPNLFTTLEMSSCSVFQGSDSGRGGMDEDPGGRDASSGWARRSVAAGWRVGGAAQCPGSRETGWSSAGLWTGRILSLRAGLHLHQVAAFLLCASLWLALHWSSLDLPLLIPGLSFLLPLWAQISSQHSLTHSRRLHPTPWSLWLWQVIVFCPPGQVLPFSTPLLFGHLEAPV